MILLHGKHYYPGDVYPIPIAAGGVAVAAWTRRSLVARTVLVAAMVVAGLFFLPFSLPVLAEGPMVDYAAFVGRALHVGKSTMATEHGQSAALPTDWADMHGWPELAAAVARVYWTLPLRDARMRRSSPATTVKPPPSTSSVHGPACRRRFPDTTTTGSGEPTAPPETSSSTSTATAVLPLRCTAMPASPPASTRRGSFRTSVTFPSWSAPARPKTSRKFGLL